MIGIIYDSDEKNDSGYTIYMWYLTLSCVNEFVIDQCLITWYWQQSKWFHTVCNE
jgi:hypothetical protein